MTRTDSVTPDALEDLEGSLESSDTNNSNGTSNEKR